MTSRILHMQGYQMPISDDDLNYLRNINTRPGPTAGRSIDPTKPGPDADRITELEREIAREEKILDYAFAPDVYRKEAHEKLPHLRAELFRLRNEQPSPGPSDKTD